jgi:hypothetical protein
MSLALASCAGCTAGGQAGSTPPVDADAGADVALTNPASLGTTLCGPNAPDLPLGTMHLLTNMWTDPQCMTCTFVDDQGHFGWKWQRGDTPNPVPPGAVSYYPNYPELEFGTPPFMREPSSTTTLLPIQLSALTSASMTVNVSMAIDAANTSGEWDLAFEMWLTDVNPLVATPTIKYEIMVFFGVSSGYYPTTATPGTVLNDGINDYVLYVTSSTWGNGYNYRQYRDQANSSTGAFNGKLNIFAFLQDVMSADPASSGYWLTRFELGNEIYQNSAATTTIQSIAFEVNGTTEEGLP